MKVFDDIPGLELQNGEPVFSEPWEANAFALAIELNAKGLFTWEEWAFNLGKCIKDNSPDTPYYESWLDALEQIVQGKSLLDCSEIDARKEAWASAVAATPHGQPIELKNALSNGG